MRAYSINEATQSEKTMKKNLKMLIKIRAAYKVCKAFIRESDPNYYSEKTSPEETKVNTGFNSVVEGSIRDSQAGSIAPN